MNPNQPPQTPQPQNGYPPQYPPAQPTPPQTQPQPQFQQPTPQTPGQPVQPGQANWYSPPEKKETGPASAADYVGKFQQTQDPTGFNMPGASESHSIDYLNQLSGTTPAVHSTAPPNQKMLLIGVGIFLAISLSIILMLFTNQKGPTGVAPEKTLYTTIFNNSQITKMANKNIRDSKLSSLNSAYNGQLLNDLTAMTEPLAKGGIDTKELTKSAKKAADFNKTIAKLDDARLNAIFDQKYAAELDYELQSIVMLMEKIQKTSHNKSIKDFVKTDISNYKTIQDGLKDYNENLIPR